MDAKTAERERKELREALTRCVRWVGKGVANHLFDDCTVLPRAAEVDLRFAERILSETKGAR